MEELQRLIRQQRRDQETDGTGRGWSKHRTYSVDFHYIVNDRNPLNPFQREVKGKLVGRQVEGIRCQANLKLILKGLPEKECFIIKRRLEGCPQEEIAQELNTYQKEISRIINRFRPCFGLEKRGG